MKGGRRGGAFLVSRFLHQQVPPPRDPGTWDNAAVQNFFAEIDADEKFFGIERPEQRVDETRKAERLREIETLLVSSDYNVQSTKRRAAGNAGTSAGERFGGAADGGRERDFRGKNERLIFELRARRQREAEAFVEAQRKRDSEIARLREMERKAKADGYVNKKLLVEIEELKRRMAMSKYMGVKQDD